MEQKTHDTENGREPDRAARDRRGLDAAVAAQRKAKKKRLTNMLILLAVILALAAGGWLLYRYLSAANESESERTYRVDAVSSGEIHTVIDGSGTLSAVKASTVTAAAAATVEAVYKQSGDAVTAGEAVLTLTSEEIDDQLDTLYDSLSDVRAEIADTTQLRTGSKLLITGGVAGVVKDIRVAAGDEVTDADYLCLLSTDGKMKVEIPAAEGMRAYDAVTVLVDGTEETGYVYAVTDGTASVVIDENSYDMGTPATVYGADGAQLGSGELTVNEYVAVTASAGVIDAVSVVENQIVGKTRTLFKLKKGAPTDEYIALKDEESDLLDEIDELNDALTVTAEWDGYLTSVPVRAGDEVAMGAELCSLASSEGFTMSLSIDELDVSAVHQGQEVTVTLDAVDGTFTGKVTDISYAGSGSYVTTYTATVTTDPIEGAYPGMSASAEIITETSGVSLIVQVAAVQYDGRGDERTTYVYLAPADSAAQQTYAESAIDLDSLEKATVTTGMSDGSYIVIESDALESGSLVLVPVVTTNATYTESNTSTTATFGGMGGMSGMPGGMPAGGDFSGGGFNGGNMGGGTGGGPRG